MNSPRRPLNAISDTLASARRALIRRAAAWGGWDSHGTCERLIPSGAVIAALALLSMAAVDRPLALYLHDHVQGDILAIWETITQLGVATGYVIVGIVLLLGGWVGTRIAAHEETVRFSDRLRRYAALLLGGLALSGAVLNLAKIGLGRQRPEYLFADGFYGFKPMNLDTGANSFPSGHSQTIWALAAVLCIAFPRHRLTVCTFAAVVALSRVVIGEHYLSDVLVGSYLGVAGVVVLAPWILGSGGRGEATTGDGAA